MDGTVGAHGVGQWRRHPAELEFLSQAGCGTGRPTSRPHASFGFSTLEQEGVLAHLLPRESPRLARALRAPLFHTGDTDEGGRQALHDAYMHNEAGTVVMVGLAMPSATGAQRGFAGRQLRDF